MTWRRRVRQLASAMPLAGAQPFIAMLLPVVTIVSASQAPLPVYGTGIALSSVPLWFLLWRAAARGVDLAPFLIYPTVISATQNVYLLIVAEGLDARSLQVLVVLNFAFACGTVLLLLVRGGIRDLRGPAKRMLSVTLVTAGSLLLYGLVTIAVFDTGLTSAVASARNFLAPMVFLLVGLLASRSTRVSRYARLVVFLGLFTIAFGVFERWVPNFWQTVELDTLWEKKGLPVNPGTALPFNFYSSETLAGNYLRRMAGPFADPVNFGSFLFAVGMAAWYVRMPLSAILAVAAAVLAISKGAAMSLMVAIVVWVGHYRPKVELVGAVLGTAGVGSAVLAYTIFFSAGSTMAHVGGLVAPLQQLPLHPWGYGLGGSGVLAGLFGDAGTAGGESGIGVIVSQLGIFGLIAYVTFFGIVGHASLRLVDRRERVLALSLVVAFATNAAFNEVALSPNSCAPYFVLLGLLIGRHSSCDSPKPKTAGRNELRIERAVGAEADGG